MFESVQEYLDLIERGDKANRLGLRSELLRNVCSADKEREFFGHEYSNLEIAGPF